VHLQTILASRASQFFAVQALAPGVIAPEGGSIINMASNSWMEASGGFPAYATAKAAVHGLTRTMARELGDHRIPATPVPARLIEPAYVANMALFLASDDAAMCTANNCMVEAGSI
jgi:D-xylose 1-dehydrogenase